MCPAGGEEKERQSVRMICKLTGAGVLPFCRDGEGKFYMILGREAFAPKWPGSLRWSGFAGSAYSSEDAEATATRECVEESMGVLFSDQASFLASLREKEYSIRVTTRAKKGYHVTFVKEFPMRREVEVSFFNTRRSLLCLSRLAEEERRFTFASSHPHYREGHVICRGGGVEETVVSVVSAERKEDLFRSVFRVKGSDGEVRTRRVVHVAGEVDLEYTRWILCRIDMTNLVRRLLPTLPKGAVQFCETVDMVHSVGVNPSYLEKNRLSIWSFDDLRRSLTANGKLFRPIFAIVLRRVLAEFATPKEGSFCE